MAVHAQLFIDFGEEGGVTVDNPVRATTSSSTRSVCTTSAPSAMIAAIALLTGRAHSMLKSPASACQAEEGRVTL